MNTFIPIKPLISIVIPCFNEVSVIDETINQLGSFILANAEYEFELIFVDDGSVDQTVETIKKRASQNSAIKLICLSRNFGHQIAVTAGIDAASGSAVVLMDADLQDPPEVIEQMIIQWARGYDVVYGTRVSRQGETVFKLKTSKYFYRVLNYLSDIAIPLDTGDFRLMSRRVVDQLKEMPERSRFVRGMVSWVGFRQIGVPYERVGRFAGESKYPLKKMFFFAIDGILSFSTKPLKLSVAMGFSCAALAVAGIFYAIILRLFTSVWVEGWTALMLAILLIGGVQLIAIGILGEYIGRIYDETKRRPLYVVGEKIGF